jgi:hypothetical protein
MPEKYKNWEVDYYLKNDMGDLYVGKAKIFFFVVIKELRWHVRRT